MLLLIIQMTLISIIFIFLVHHLFHFFKSMLTVPKIKDLVNSPNKKYENIYNTIYHNNVKSSQQLNKNNSTQGFDYSKEDLLPRPVREKGMFNKEELNTSMKDELKSFFKKQLDGKSNDLEMNSSTTNLGELDTIQSASSYYEFK